MPASAPRSRLERSAGQSLLQSLLHVLSCDFSPPVLATLHMTNLHMTKISVLATALSLIVLAACKPDAPQPDTAKQPSAATRSEEHTSELQSLMRTSYAVFCLKNKITQLINLTT